MTDYAAELRRHARKLPRPAGDTPAVMEAAADEIERLRAAAQPAPAPSDEIAKLKTVMIAAAEEIAAHWDAHCDADGYGPVNLLRRLEEGIPAEYGYTAGAFATLKAERDAATTQPAPAAVPADLMAYMLQHLQRERHRSDGFTVLGNETARAAKYDRWISVLLAAAPAPATGGEHE